MTPLLKTEKLSVSYRNGEARTSALDEFELEVDAGQIVGLIGETGCGKSTVARAIMGALDERNAAIYGTIHFNDVDIIRRSQTLRELRGRQITFVPQNPYASLNPLFTVGYQILDFHKYSLPFRRRFFSRKWKDEAMADVLEMLATVQLVDGEHLLAKYPHQLSGGQLQRLLIALALLPAPKLIIADEATSALDNLVQSNVLQLFRRIAAERNVAVLFITHSLAAAWDVCDRVTVMHRGRVVEAGTRDAVFHSPRHPYSREIMRSARKVAHESWASDVDAELSGTACAFCKRCPRSSKRCEQVRPSLENFNGHAVACHHPILTEGAVSLTNT